MMDEIRKTLARDTVLGFYYVRKSAIIQADASQSGLESGIMQQGRPVAFASCALTDGEHNYSKIEKEMLAICIGDDPVMQCLRRFIQRGWPKHKSAVPPEIQSYWGIRDELHEADSLLLFGNRPIVPTLLRSSMLQLIHEGHLGGDQCKPRARSSMYWPGLHVS